MYDYDTCKEAQLVKLAKKQDAKAFSKLYETVYIDLYRFALYTMRHRQDAEDAVSEAVVLAYEHMHKLRKDEAFRSWIFQILANVCKKKLKENSRKVQLLKEEEPAAEVDYGMAHDVRNAFFILSEEEQLIIALSVFGGYNSKEIEGMLHINANTVRSKRSRALEKMGCILEA